MPDVSEVVKDRLYGRSYEGRWVVAVDGDWRWGPFANRDEAAEFIAAMDPIWHHYAVNLTDHPHWFD